MVGQSVESVRRGKGHGGKDLPKSQVLSLEWKTEGVSEDESGDSEVLMKCRVLGGKVKESGESGGAGRDVHSIDKT